MSHDPPNLPRSVSSPVAKAIGRAFKRHSAHDSHGFLSQFLQPHAWMHHNGQGDVPVTYKALVDFGYLSAMYSLFV